MQPLATVPQLATHLRVPIGELDVVAAEQDLRLVSGLVRWVAGQDITFVAHDTVVLTGGEQYLTLPQRPVVVDADNPLTVTEMVNGTAPGTPVVENVGYTRVGGRLDRGPDAWWWGASRLQGWPYTRGRGVWAPYVSVTYSHGYREVPDAILKVVLDALKPDYTNPSGLRSWQVPEYSETYATETLGAGAVGTIRATMTAIGVRRGGAFSI